MTEITKKIEDAFNVRWSGDWSGEAMVLWRLCDYFEITEHQVIGLIEGTHVVVPVEPTQKMLVESLENGIWMEEIRHNRCDWPSLIRRIYKAMLKAAQGD